jgi:hypothetical protein
MPNDPRLIIQLPRGGAIDRQLSAKPPRSVAGGEVVVDAGPTDTEGELEPLVVLVEAAEELRDDELAAILDAAGHTSRGVILRIMRNA